MGILSTHRRMMAIDGLSAASVLHAGSLLGPNLLLNPGFEIGGTGGNFNGGAEIDDGVSDNFDSWTEVNVDDANGNKVEATATVHEGLVALKLTNTTDGDAQIWQGVVTLPGAGYRLTFWTRGDGVVSGRYGVRDTTNGAWIRVFGVTGLTGVVYTQVTYEFAAPAGCILVTLYFRANPAVGVCYFDTSSINRT